MMDNAAYGVDYGVSNTANGNDSIGALNDNTRIEVHLVIIKPHTHVSEQPAHPTSSF